MRIVVSGAAGFVGREIISEAGDHEWVALDTSCDTLASLPNVECVAGDLCDQAVLKKVFADGCDAVIHLATVPGGAAEQSPGPAREVNVNGTMLLAEYAAKAGARPRFVFASSIAVFGDPLPPFVDDATPPAPKTYYGTHKAMMETWLSALTRRGELDALSLRLSGVIARPKARSGMKSAFLSDVFHAMRAGEPFVMPVSSEATCWLTTVSCAAKNFHHALSVDLADAPNERCVNLPTLRVRIGDLVNEIAEQTGQPRALVAFEPDEAIEAAFGSQTPMATECADAMRFAGDDDVQTLVGRALASIQ